MISSKISSLYPDVTVRNLTITGYVFTNYQLYPTYDDDEQAASHGVGLGEVYHNGSFWSVRVD